MPPVERIAIAPRGSYKERGIVLRVIRYQDNRLILNLLTQNHGRISYITSRSKAGLYQPMFILEFEASKRSAELHKLSQCENHPALHSIAMSPVKSTIVMFISELLYKILHEPLDDNRMYDFIVHSIVELDKLDNQNAMNFHIWFLTHLAFFMGYSLPSSEPKGRWYDIKTGLYCSYIPSHPLRLAPEWIGLLHSVNTTPLSEVSNLGITTEQRRGLLGALVDYYNYHCDTFGSVKSLDILREVF